jgi:MFS family permease
VTAQQDPGPDASWARGIVVALLAFTTILSQFFRSAIAVIAPELVTDLDLSANMLAWTSSAYFLALFVAQPLVGLLFDRIGARRTVVLLSVAMAGGAGLHATAIDGPTLIAARFVVGLGCAASIMSAVVLIAQWFPRDRWATALSWIFGLSQIGIVLAGTPLAMAADRLGWRMAFLFAAAAAALCGLLFFIGLRDPPRNQAGDLAAPASSPLGLWSGLKAVFATPGVGPVFTLFAVAYAASVTITALWVGTYLKDVHGLDAVARGHVLTTMAIAQTAAILAYGPLDRVFNSRKRVILGGGAATFATLATLAIVPAPRTDIAIALLIWLAAVSGYGTVLLTHVRSLFPDHLAGRGATTGNMAQLLGTVLLPMLTGLVPGLVLGSALTPGSPYPVEAYRWIFTIVATALGLGLAVYLRSRDIKPREATRETIDARHAQR